MEIVFGVLVFVGFLCFLVVACAVGSNKEVRRDPKIENFENQGGHRAGVDMFVVSVVDGNDNFHVHTFDHWLDKETGHRRQITDTSICPTCGPKKE